MALDSRAACKERSLEVGISEAEVTALANGGIATFSQFAFCCAYQPRAQSDAPLFDHLETVLGSRPSGADASAYRCSLNVMLWP